MELVLELQKAQVRVTCDASFSHAFNMSTVVFPDETNIGEHPEEYGKKLYDALFPSDTSARRALERKPDRLLLVPQQGVLDAISWEYLYGRFGSSDPSEAFLALCCPLVRGLPTEQRTATSAPAGGLHIVAVPSSPLNHAVESLPIESDWMLLQEIVQDVPRALTLERCLPPTLKRLRELLANQAGRVVHFLGHGGQGEQGAVLCFEQENADLDEVIVQRLMQRLQNSAFLVTLSACVSATPGPTAFSNLAANLVRNQVPYALGMRLSVFDTDARIFFHTFYSELARGSSVEQAVFQARLTLDEKCPRRWMLGVPVLYTALDASAAGFVCPEGSPTILNPLPPRDLAALPPTDGPFQGRVEELVGLGSVLTAARRPSLLTIHGGGGQGKTALARQAAERFAWAWPGGVWAISLETSPSRATFIQELARFLGVESQNNDELRVIERQVFQRLGERRSLLILDNAETILEGVDHADPTALDLVACWKQLLATQATLLLTSRELLGWAGESYLELGGLHPEEGAALFEQYAAGRASETERQALRTLSERLEGHPLSLRLLGLTFGSSAQPFSALLATIEEQLLKAFDKYMGPEHRHYKLYACLEVSVRALEPALRVQLSGLWVFHVPFLAETAVAIFDPEHEASEQSTSPVREALAQLWQRGLLSRQQVTVRDGTLTFYALLPTTRPYVESSLEQGYDREAVLARFGQAHLALVRYIHQRLDRSAAAVVLAQICREDLDRGRKQVEEPARGEYALRWGWVLYRLGHASQGLEVLEEALETLQGTADPLLLQALNNLALVYDGIGQPQRALELFEQTLPITREVGDRAGEATSLNNIAMVYQRIGQPQRARELFEQVLPIWHEVGDRSGEAATLHNLAVVYRGIGQPLRAREHFEQALSIRREVGDRSGEATTLSNLAMVYHGIGQPQRALELYEQALPIRREVSDRAGEATSLHNLAAVYQGIGQPQRALELYKQALPIIREVGDRAGEAGTLSNLAAVYQRIGQPQRALELHEQALLIMREVGDRAGEATSLHNLATVYQEIGQPQRALELFEQALPIRREVGDRAGEASSLSNLAIVYQGIGQPHRALELYEQALPIMREVGNRAGEAATLNGLAYLYQSVHRFAEALEAFEASLRLERETSHPAGEIAGLVGLALLLSRHLDRSAEAVDLLELALARLRSTDLTHDAAGHTAADLENLLDALQQRAMPAATTPSATLPVEQLRILITNTLAVLTSRPDQRKAWTETLQQALAQAQQQGEAWQQERELFLALLALLQGQESTLPADHPYVSVLVAIQQGIAQGGSPQPGVSMEIIEAIREFVNSRDWTEAQQVVEARQEVLFQPEVQEVLAQLIAQAREEGEEEVSNLLETHQTILQACQQQGITPTFAVLRAQQKDESSPVDAELIASAIAALRGEPQEKMAFAQTLMGQAAQTTDEQLKALLMVIQLALFGGNRTQLGQSLEGVYRQAWQAIVAGIELE